MAKKNKKPTGTPNVGLRSSSALKRRVMTRRNRGRAATSTATRTASRSPTPVRTASRSPTPVRTASRSPTPVRTASRSPTPVRTDSRSPTPIPTDSRSPSPIRTDSRSPSPIRTDSRSPTPIRTASRSSSPHQDPPKVPQFAYADFTLDEFIIEKGWYHVFKYFVAASRLRDAEKDLTDFKKHLLDLEETKKRTEHELNCVRGQLVTCKDTMELELKEINDIGRVLVRTTPSVPTLLEHLPYLDVPTLLEHSQNRNKYNIYTLTTPLFYSTQIHFNPLSLVCGPILVFKPLRDGGSNKDAGRMINLLLAGYVGVIVLDGAKVSHDLLELMIKYGGKIEDFIE